jgi:hypothetical protein
MSIMLKFDELAELTVVLVFLETQEPKKKQSNNSKEIIIIFNFFI